jgi:hypothetical protein
MSNEVVKLEPSSIVDSAWSRDRLELLKRTICKDASDDEFAIFSGSASVLGSTHSRARFIS